MSRVRIAFGVPLQSSSCWAHWHLPPSRLGPRCRPRTSRSWWCRTPFCGPVPEFVPELLTTEGLNGFQVAQLPELTPSFLANYDVVILPHLSLTTAQADSVAGVRRRRGHAGRIPAGRATCRRVRCDLFGDHAVGGLAEDRHRHSVRRSPGRDVMRFHGTADRYATNGATMLATLYAGPTSATSSPAAAINNHGSGQGDPLQLRPDPEQRADAPRQSRLGRISERP